MRAEWNPSPARSWLRAPLEGVRPCSPILRCGYASTVGNACNCEIKRVRRGALISQTSFPAFSQQEFVEENFHCTRFIASDKGGGSTLFMSYFCNAFRCPSSTTPQLMVGDLYHRPPVCSQWRLSVILNGENEMKDLSTLHRPSRE